MPHGSSCALALGMVLMHAAAGSNFCSWCHLLAALWEPMSLGRPCESDDAVRSFTKRGSAIDARLHTFIRMRSDGQKICPLMSKPLQRSEPQVAHLSFGVTPPVGRL